MTPHHPTPKMKYYNEIFPLPIFAFILKMHQFPQLPKWMTEKKKKNSEIVLKYFCWWKSEDLKNYNA